TAGLRFGVIEGLLDRLNADPRNLEIVVVGNYQLGPDWFTGIRQSSLAAFVAPTTRSISATVNIATLNDERRMARAVQSMPTGGGDRLLSGESLPVSWNETVLSASVAKALGVEKGGEAAILVTRRLNGKNEMKQLTMKVIAIAPAGLVPQDA